jgi:Mrp family chromosome partitioning ATPase/capsular polysaccharide biosynthesis protein
VLVAVGAPSSTGAYPDLNTREITEDRLVGPPSGLPGLLMSEQLAQSIRVLRRRWRIIVLIPLLALAVSLVVSTRSATEYSATAKIVIAPYNAVTVLLSPGSNPTSADPERDLNTEVSEITETPMAHLVQASLRLPESSTDLLNQVSATLEGTTNIVDISALDPNPSRAARIANAFASDYVGFRLSSERAALQQSVASDQVKLASLPVAQRSAAAGRQLQSDISTLQADSDGLTSDAQLSETAAVPTSPAKPKPLIDALIAIVVGFLIAIVAMIVLELLDRTVRDDEDAAAVAQLPSLGVIPKHSRLNARATSAKVIDWHLREGWQLPSGLSVTVPRHGAGEPAGNGSLAATSRKPPAPKPRAGDWDLEESYSSLAVSLLSLRLGTEENVVMITSPGPQDGKTSVSLGLAAALAELGQRVTVVECDLRRPRFADYLGLPPGTSGLSSILAGNITLPAGLIEVAAGTRQALPTKARGGARRNGSTLSRTGRSFSVLPCGPIPTRALALLRGPELAPLLHQLQSSSDVVLIDTPPLGAIKDAVVLAECVDQIVLVARVGHTRRDALARCRAAVDQLGSPVLGIVTVGGPRGGALDYYFRPELDVSITQLSEPKLVAVRQRPSQPQPEAETQVETQVETLPSQQPPAAAAKGGRSRRRASADNSG